MYNMTGVDEAVTIVDYWKAVDVLAGGWFSIFSLATIMIVLLVVYRRFDNDFRESLLASTAITSILAVLLFFATIISWKVLLFPISLFAMSILLFIFSE